MGYMEAYCGNYLYGNNFWQSFESVTGNFLSSSSILIIEKINNAYSTITDLYSSLLSNQSIADEAITKDNLLNKSIVFYCAKYLEFRFNLLRDKLFLKTSSEAKRGIRIYGTLDFQYGLTINTEEVQITEESFSFSQGGSL